MAAIVIQDDNNSQLVALRNPLVYNWKFIPPKFRFFWLMSSATPANFQAKVEFPQLDTLPEFAGYTDWLFEASLTYQGTSVPFVKVEGGFTYSGSLGTPFTSGGYFYRKTLNFSFLNLQVLSVNQYNCTVGCKITAVNPITNQREDISENSFSINLIVDSVYLLTAPFDATWQGQQLILTGNGFAYSPMVFNWNVGDPFPEAQDIFYFPPNTSLAPTPVASDSILVTSNTYIHNYHSKLSLSLGSALSSLVPGTYNYTLDIFLLASISGINPVTVEIIVNVFPPATGLYVNPNSLDFNFVLGGPQTPNQTLNLSSSNPWQVLGSLPDWLNLAQLSGTSNANILVGINPFAELATGTYTANIVITDGVDTVSVPVNLNFYAFLYFPFRASSLFFTKNTDYLVFDSTTPNTYIDLSLEIKVYKINSTDSITYNRTFRVPLYKGGAEFHVGTIVDTLLEDIERMQDYIPDLASNYFKNQQLPAEILLSYEEKEYVDTGATNLISNSFDKFLMIKGYKPLMTAGSLGLLSVAQQDITRITPNSIISVSFVNFGLTVIEVKQNGHLLESFNVLSFNSGGAQKVIFSYFRFINNFTPGDTIELIAKNKLDTRAHRYLVMRSGQVSTYFIYENHNRVLETFEFIGRRVVESKIIHTTNKKIKQLYAYEKKVYAEEVQTLSVNTGHLTKTEHNIVKAIVKSPNVWCSLDSPSGPYFLVDSTTTKVTNQDTSTNEEFANVEFNIIENPDAAIYPF